MSRRQLTVIAIGAGTAVGIAYALSPLTIICLPAVIAMSLWAGAGLDSRERRWFIALIALAAIARLAAVSALFLSWDGRMPFESLFGDELFFKNRSLWIRNHGAGLPMSPADVIYAFEDVGISSYLYGLSLLQAIVGKAPYGIHVLNSACYLTAVLMLFRLVRPVFGGVAALTGMGVLLFTPSLFMWSISALKEPSYTLAAAVELWCAVHLARSATWRERARWLIGVAVATVALETLRRGGSMVALAGAAGGLFLGFVLPRPKLTLLTAAFVPVAVVGLLMVPPVQQRALDAVRGWAVYHAGHVGSAGYSYHILEGRYYFDARRIYDMPGDDAIVFVLNSFKSYVTEPAPWRIESKPMLAYLPEQMFWYVLLALAPFGVVAAVRRDPMLAALLVTHAFAAATVVAMTSGNIGTLIRHRGLVMPYLAWLAGLGLYELMRSAVTGAPVRANEGIPAHGHS